MNAAAGWSNDNRWEDIQQPLARQVGRCHRDCGWPSDFEQNSCNPSKTAASYEMIFSRQKKKGD
ncbi:hypothetical protein, partial [Pseudomonas sp. RW10S2]|uniref:hypothetical protein n=1 Tax=Pseudomonas sp. RW10S2 TaxID=459637 RepID=UPI001EE32763